MLKRACLSMVCCLFLAGGYCLAEKKQIKLKNGETIIREVVEQTPEGIKVKDPMGPTVFYPKDKIVSIGPVYDVKEDYADRLSKLKKDDFEGQLSLGQWALENKLYAQAVTHLEEAVKLKNEDRSRLLLRQAKAKLEDTQKATETPSSGGGETPSSAGGDGGGPTAAQMVTDEDIQKIRMAELAEKDPVIVELRKNVVERFLEQVRGRGDFEKKGADTEFQRLPNARKAKYMIDHTSPDDPLRADIVVKSDPASMREFRSGVWRWVSNSCAAVTCHGAAKGQGGLKLWNVVGRGDNVDYTNFLILDAFHTKTGLQVIRRDEPEDSLLLQYGLPDSQAKYRHPKEKSPPFTSRNSPAYKTTLDWILSLKRPLHPEYGLQNLPPHVMKRIDPLFGLPSSAPTKDKDAKSTPDKPSKPPF